MKKGILAWILVLVLLLSGCSDGPEPETTGVPSEESLIVHFLDVGQADCALLESGGEYLLIDGGNRADSDLVVSLLEQQGVEELAAVVCTHAHEDHVGGLPAVLAVYPTAAVYAPTRTYASQVFDDFVYYADQQGLEITIPRPRGQLDAGQRGDYRAGAGASPMPRPTTPPWCSGWSWETRRSCSPGIWR